MAMKFMLLQHYGLVEGDVPPMSQWAPEDVVAHIQFQKDLNAELRERGEFVEAQALTGPEAAKIVLASDGAPIVTDGPFAESKELLAGWRTVDVESEERALESGAQGSEGAGPEGRPRRAGGPAAPGGAAGPRRRGATLRRLRRRGGRGAGGADRGGAAVARAGDAGEPDRVADRGRFQADDRQDPRRFRAAGARGADRRRTGARAGRTGRR